ncbi:uncharacterized protein [Amphiura filiformis]|uniref:uncharacterized protein n=1 Tax=Amphiura filiformis TaxID=82378 RepID=UPI003B2198B1
MSEFADRVSTDVDDLENTGIQWPSANAHLRPSAHRDITYIVSVAPNKPNEPKVKTKEPPAYVEQSSIQPVPYIPEKVPQRDPNKDVDGLENTGIQWPSLNAHLRPTAHRDITYIVSVAPNKPNEPKVDTKEPPAYVEQSSIQPIPYIPERVPQRDPNKELTMDDWDPMKEDFESKGFNSYNSGPAAGLSGRQDINMSHQRSESWPRLHVGGLPREMSEDGLASLIGQVCQGQVRNIKVVNPTDETKSFAYGFFSVPSANEVQKVIAKLDGYRLKEKILKVSLANPREPTRGADGSPRGMSYGARPKESQMNNNTMQNRPITPRTLENRYGKAVPKSPTGDEHKLQNGMHNSGDEIKHSATNMVPMSVTRNMYNAKQHQETGAAGGARDGTMPNKGRGHVLQSIMSGKQCEPVGRQPPQRANSSATSKTPSPSKTSKRSPCANCGGLGSHKCSKCKTPYCTKECQAEHWPKHKLQCKAIAEGKMPSEPAQVQQAPPPQPPPPRPQQVVKKASAVYGRFLSKDVPEAKPEEKTLDVLVTAVLNPECVYVNLIQRTCCLPYVELTNLMKATYPGLPTAKELHFYLTQVGELCAAEWKGKWHRAEILSVNSPEEGVDVMLVDFGERMRVPRNNLKKLKEEMVKLPKQGVKCFLTGIRPSEGDDRWSARARELLRARILKKECSAKFKSYDAKKGHEINLFASQGAQASVSDELISAQLAEGITTGATSSPSPQAAAATAAVDTERPVSIMDTIAEGSKLDIKLTYFASMDLIYGQLAENSSQIAELQTSLNTAGVVPDSSRTYFLPSCDQLVAALYTDKMWYRARVNSITTPQQCSVSFVDYGNREEIAIKDCQVLPAQFETTPYQAMGLVLAGIQRPQKGWGREIDDAFKVWLGEGDVECMVVRKHDEYLEVEMFNPKGPDPPKSFNSILADAGFTSAEQPAATHQVSTPSGVQPAAITASVVWVNDPSTFFIQNLEDQEILATLAVELQTSYENSANDNYTPAVGDLCAALFDGFWSRGKVLECMGPISTKVFFLDFGNESVIENDNIRALKPQWKDIPPKAMMCGLDMIAPPSGQKEWSEQSIVKMKEMLENKICTIHITRVIAGKSYVKAVLEQKDIGDELVKAKLAQVVAMEDLGSPVLPTPDKEEAVTKVQLVVEAQPTPVALTRVPDVEMPIGEFPAMVAWLNNPSEIFIQIAFKENIEAFSEMTIGLQSHYEALPPGTYKPQVGEICVTKTYEWLRARVLGSVAPNGYRVQFIDYGNEEVVQGDVRMLDDKFTKYPAAAGKVSLSDIDPAGESQWSEQAIEWLNTELINKPVTVRRDKNNSITILKEDISIAQKMIAAGHAKPSAPTPKPVAKPLTLGTIKPPAGEFKGQVLHINNPSDMFISIFRDEEVRSFQKLTTDLSTLCPNLGPSQSKLATGDLCMAKASDGEWYRARVIESHNEDVIKVNFVDFGNDEEVKRNNTHLLLERFAQLPAMAVRCALANVCPPGGGQTWSKEATSFLHNKIMGQLILAKVVKESPGTYTVTINLPQRDGPSLSVSQELIGTMLAKDPSQSPPRKEVKQQAARTFPPKVNQDPHALSPKANQAPSVSPPKTNQTPNASPPTTNQAPRVSPPKPNQTRKDVQSQSSQYSSPRQSQGAAGLESGGPGLKPRIPPPSLAGPEFEGRVIMVTHPIDFYIGLHGTTKENEQAMQKLKSELSEHYSSAPKTGYKPGIGDHVVAERKGMWGRALVLGEPIPNKARLLFADYGIKDDIEYDNIREMEAKFAELPMMAVRCGLADITNTTPGKKFWPQETCGIVREKILGCPCKAVVKGVSPKSGLHFVELEVTMKNGKPLQVRDEMIKYKLATPSNRMPRSPDARGPNQALSPPFKSQQGRSPDSNQIASNRGAFQKYQKNQPAHSKSPDGVQQHPQRGPRPSVSPTPNTQQHPQRGPRQSVSPTPNTKPTESSQIPKAQVPASKTFTGSVLWFNHPGSFYVQPKEFIQQAIKLYEALQSLTDDPQPGYRPTVGKLVVAKYENEWCRAMVESITGATAKVMFYDYGNEETIPTNAIRQMPDRIGAMPVLTLHCAVAGIVPSGGKNWSEDSIQMIKPKVLEQLCQVEVIDNTGDICQVNLIVTGDNITIDVQADLIKSTMATEASTTAANQSPTGRRTPDLAIKFPDQEVAAVTHQAETRDGSSASSSKPSERTISLPKLPLPSSEFQAVVVFVNHPGSFFIHIANEENAHAITKLGSDLNSYYSQPDRQSIMPKEGGLCAAQFSQDNGWYRAKVVGAASHNSAKVLFVDFGNEEVVNHTAIKKLSEEFHKIPVMAQHCCLGNVQPRADQGGQWSSSSAAATYMRRQVTNGLCQIQVVDASTNPVTVELVYDAETGNSTKLSEDLIKKNLASHGAINQAGAPPKPSPSNLHQKTPTPKDAAAKPKQDNQQGSTKRGSATQIQQAQPPTGTFEGAISWVNTPEDLYITVICDKNKAVNKVIQEASMYYSSAVDALPPVPPSHRQCMRSSVCRNR